MNMNEYQSLNEKKKHWSDNFPYNTYLCSIPLDFPSVPLHWHDECEFIYIKKGMGRVYVGGKEYSCLSGDIFVVLPGVIHGIEPEQNESMEYENIIFSTGLLESISDDSYKKVLFPFIHEEGTLANPKFSARNLESHPCSQVIHEALDYCDEICKTFPIGYELIIKAKLFEIFYSLISDLNAENNSSFTLIGAHKVKPALKYVEMNFSKRITIEDAAGECGFSASHFMRFFKETCGVSFINYLNDYRLAMAAKLIQNSEMSILEISESTGFDNLSYFNRRFKNKYNTTPSQYRKAKKHNRQ